MLELYIKLVKSGKRTIEQVPTKYREQVKAVIEQQEDDIDEE